MIKAMSMKARLWSLVVLAAFGMCALAVLAFTSHHINQRALTVLYQRDVNALVQLQHIENQLSEVRFRAAGVLLEQLPVPGALNHLREARKNLDKAWQTIEQRQSDEIVELASLPLLEEAKKGWPRVASTLTHIEKALETKDNAALTEALEDHWPVLHKSFVKPIQALIPAAQQSAETGYATAISDSQSALVTGLMTAGACLLGLSVVAGLTIRSLLRPLAEVEASILRIAQGDLASPLPAARQDEVGQMISALFEMQNRLRALVSDVRDTTAGLHTASAEVAAGNQDLSLRTEQAAANLQQTASSVEQLSGAVALSATAASEANSLSQSAASVAEQGAQAVSKVIHTMNDISSSSKRISEIIGVIDGIAFQTNILALNAAVEAARAGEQGRGFAVVASEVRSLAQRSAAAAKEIKTLIVESVDKVDSGTRLVSEAGSTMSAIETSVQRVTEIIGRITVSTSEQSAGIQVVNGSVAQLDTMTQKNAALVEQSAAAAESMKEQAERLSSIVATFQLGRA
ncbi:MAG: methyl-accepting chemotaxis protein [Ideonella sp.]|nr:methyl-accepting chemotaxis protein [Ideonella sp.]